MNTDLIKQLELAIAVEKGEVPLSEVQWKRRDQTESEMPWRACACGPQEWSFDNCQYRRKLKPLELWMNQRHDGYRKFFESEAAAMDNAENERVSGRGPYSVIAKRMREVTND